MKQKHVPGFRLLASVGNRAIRCPRRWGLGHEQVAQSRQLNHLGGRLPFARSSERSPLQSMPQPPQPASSASSSRGPRRQASFTRPRHALHLALAMRSRTTAQRVTKTVKRSACRPLSTSAADNRFQTVIAAFSRSRGVEVEPGWGSGNWVLKVNAKILAMLTSSGFVAKLPKARVDQLVSERAGVRFDPRKNGRVMKEWFVAGAGCDWLALAREAHRFVEGDRKR
ncbi:MAG: TfoX/Sxy family protein [Myxococcales bacterium]|nr:TfoX/Sxy family protein [Myxococcales bacterium]